MAETVTLTAERRQETGKGAARRMRQAGKIPAEFLDLNIL